jgi:hypothetical protein
MKPAWLIALTAIPVVAVMAGASQARVLPGEVACGGSRYAVISPDTRTSS